jgi:regulation of enolase protein 1 (concanavalin A-like superfamily)
MVADYSKNAGSVQPGSRIVFEVLVNQNLITSFFNGNQVGKVRAQVPESDLKFGVYAALDKEGGYTFEFKDFKVTAVQ